MRASLLLKNGYIVTVDPERRIIPDGWVLVGNDRIVGVGSMAHGAPTSADEVIDLGGRLTIPGLVNGHNHHWGSLLKNTGEGLAISGWLNTVAYPALAHLTTEDLRIAAYVSALEQLSTGTTCSLNHLTNVNDTTTLKAIIEPAIEVGVRQLVAKELRSPPRRPFAQSHPVPPHVRTKEEELALAEEAVGVWDGAGGLITMGLALETGSGWMVHNLTSDEIIVEGAELAARLGLRISDHCSGGSAEFHALTGGSEIDYLENLGVLHENWVLVHGTGLSAHDVGRIAHAGASVITNPISNAFLTTGTVPLRELFRLEVPVGLGTDGAYVSGSLDMVRQMTFLTLLHNSAAGDPRFVSSESALEMATRGSAVALGLDHDIGSLEVGKKADLAVFDFSRPHVGIPNRPVGALVHSANGSDAWLVVVNGNVLVRDGSLCFSASDGVFEEARRRSEELLQRTGLIDRVRPSWSTF